MKKNLQKFFVEKRPFLRFLFFIFFDAVFIILSVYLAFIVRFEDQIPSRYFLNIEGIIILALLITLPFFYFSKLYSFSWTYVSAEELVSLIKAIGLSFLILTALFFVLRDYPIFSGFPHFTLFITYFFIFSGGIHFAKRIYLQIFSGGKKRRKIKNHCSSFLYYNARRGD